MSFSCLRSCWYRCWFCSKFGSQNSWALLPWIQYRSNLWHHRCPKVRLGIYRGKLDSHHCSALFKPFSLQKLRLVLSDLWQIEFLLSDFNKSLPLLDRERINSGGAQCTLWLFSRHEKLITNWLNIRWLRCRAAPEDHSDFEFYPNRACSK